MSNILLYAGLDIAAIAAPQGSGGANLLSPDPKEVFQAAGTGPSLFDLDFGSPQTFDSVFVGSTNANAAAFWVISGGLAGYADAIYVAGGTPFSAPMAGAGAPQHGFARFPAPVTARYLRLNINQPEPGPALQVGTIAVGLAFQPVFNREWGSGRTVIDTGAKETLLGGGFGIGDGAIKAGYRWVFGDLSDLEIAKLWSVARGRGETKPIVVVEDPDISIGLNERLHYGLFDRMEAYERTSPGNTRWAFSMVDWV